MSLEMQAEKIECYTKSLAVLGPIIGKLDVLSMHINSNYGEDAILRNTTYSILNSLIELTGNKEYRKMNIEVKKNPVTPEIIKQANELRDIRLKKEVKVEVKPQIIPDFSKPFVEHKFNSTNVKEMKYATYTNVLYLTYHNDSRQYSYPDVTQQEIIELINAESAGKYINQVIKPNHSYDEVTEKVGK